MKTLILEPSIRDYYIRHDNIEAIYKKLEEKRDNADVTEVLKVLHRIVNEAIRTQGAGGDHAVADSQAFKASACIAIATLGRSGRRLAGITAFRAGSAWTWFQSRA